MKTTLLQIRGMHCESCVAHIEKSLEAVPGVQAVNVELQSGRATVEHDGADEEKLVRAVASKGYSAEIAPPQTR